MPKEVLPGSVWYLISHIWVKKWLDYIGFHQVHLPSASRPPRGKHPGKIDNTDIIEHYSRSKHGTMISTILEELSPDYSWMNVQVRTTCREGEDFMVLDEHIHKYISEKYGALNEIKRFGIEDEDGEHSVEIHLKRFSLYPIPNATTFKIE